MKGPRTTEGGAPRPSGFLSLNLPSRDLEQSKLFYVSALGGELIEDGDHPRLRFTDFDVVLASQASGGVPRDAEYPHCAFTVTPTQFVALKRRLDECRIPTNEPWTRYDRPYALMYCRDPSGNQFELFAPDGAGDLPLRLGARAGGDYTTDFPALTYGSMPTPARREAPPEARPSGFNHLTVPVRDLAEGKRFLVDVLGGRVTYEGRAHVTAMIGGVEFGVAPQKGGWTAPGALYPHYTLAANPEDLAPLKTHVESFGIVTHDIATSDGVDAFFFFRDPSDNLWRLCAPRGFEGARRRLPSAGGDFTIDPAALCYDGLKSAAD